MSKLQTQILHMMITHLLIIAGSFALLVAADKPLAGIAFLGVWLLIYGLASLPGRRRENRPKH